MKDRRGAAASTSSPREFEAQATQAGAHVFRDLGSRGGAGLRPRASAASAASGASRSRSRWRPRRSTSTRTSRRRASASRRPTSASGSSSSPGSALAHGDARHPPVEGAGGGHLLARGEGAARRGHPAPRRGRARASCARSSSAPTSGITGANIAVAETGTLVVVTNEGNARLVTTLPPIHVAVVGVEKLVERFADVEPILRALPRSATGQLLTSYVSMFTGPAPGTDGAPKELHVILMDNQRSEMAKDPQLRPGAPLHPLRLVRERVPRLPARRRPRVRRGLHRRDRRDPHRLVRRARRVEGHPVALHPVRRTAPQVCPDPHRHPGAHRRAAAASSSREQGQSARPEGHLPGREQPPGLPRHAARRVEGAEALRQGRDDPPPAALPLRDDRATARSRRSPTSRSATASTSFAQAAAAKEKAALYAGCLIDFAYPETGEAVVEVLEPRGVEVVFPEGQTCCGAPARYSGAFDVAAQNAMDNMTRARGGGRALDRLRLPDLHGRAEARASRRRSARRGTRLGGAAPTRSRRRSVDFSTLVDELVAEGRLALAEAPEASRAPTTTPAT